MCGKAQQSQRAGAGSAFWPRWGCLPGKVCAGLPRFLKRLSSKWKPGASGGFVAPNSSSHTRQCWGSTIQSLAPNSPHGCPGIIHPHPQLVVPTVPCLLVLVTSLPNPFSALLVPVLSSSVPGLPSAFLCACLCWRWTLDPHTPHHQPILGCQPSLRPFSWGPCSGGFSPLGFTLSDGAGRGHLV